MARARREREPEPEEGDEDEDGLVARDFVMARLAAGRAAATEMIAAIDEANGLFLNPDDDMSGRKRKEAIGDALEAAGAATRALECAEEGLDDVDMKAGEPWEDEDGD